jgi:hypothetical protein
MGGVRQHAHRRNRQGRRHRLGLVTARPGPALITMEQARDLARVRLGMNLSTREQTHETEVKLLARSAGCRVVRGVVELTGERTLGVLRLARAGDQAGHDALMEIAKDLTSRGEKLPLPLQDYVTQEAPGFKRARQRPRDDWVTNAAIAATMAVLTDYNNMSGLKAAEIVSDVLNAEFQILKGVDAVRKIAVRHKDQGIALFIGVDRYKAALGIRP